MISPRAVVFSSLILVIAIVHYFTRIWGQAAANSGRYLIGIAVGSVVLGLLAEIVVPGRRP